MPFAAAGPFGSSVSNAVGRRTISRARSACHAASSRGSSRVMPTESRSGPSREFWSRLARASCDWRGELLDRLLDQAHASVVESIVRLLRTAGWTCATEVSFNVYGERGSIDILAFHPRSGMLLVVEAKSSIGDLQATLVTLDRKTRLAPALARERGWKPRGVARILVIQDSSASRRRVREFDATLGNAFPARTVDVKRWLRRPSAAPLSGVLFVSSGTGAVVRRRVRRSAKRAVRRVQPDDRPMASSDNSAR